MINTSNTQTQSFLAEVFKLENMVQYQDRSIVSKQLLNKSAGTLTLFAFDKEEALSEHTAPYDATVFMLDGKAEIVISEKSHTIQKGEFIIMPANIPHALKAIERFKMLLVMIRSSQ